MRRRHAGVAAAIVVAGVALAAGSPAAGGGSVTAAQLALMPLPKASLGPEVDALPLAQDSGVVTNAESAANANGKVTGAALTRLGQITGYQLDYGGVPLAGKKVFEVETGVELYGSTAEAADGFAFWRKDETDVGSLRAAGFAVVQKVTDVAGLGQEAFLDAGSITLKGSAPLAVADVAFRMGAMVVTVGIGGGSIETTRPQALALAHELETRVGEVLAGKITGPAVAVPGKAKAGPPPGGPNLEAMALRPADLGGGTVTSQGYRIDNDLDPVSEYERKIALAGPFAIVTEQVALFKTATQARFELTILADAFASKHPASAGSFTLYQPRKVAVTAGDEARAVLVKTRQGKGPTLYLGFDLVRVGKTVELVTVALPATDKAAPSELAGLAVTVAARAGGRSGGAPVA